MWLSNCTNWLGRETLLGYPRFPLTEGLYGGMEDLEDGHCKIVLYVVLEIAYYLLNFTSEGWEFDSHIFLFLIYFTVQSHTNGGQS